jgi:hypothetical protein
MGYRRYVMEIPRLFITEPLPIMEEVEAITPIVESSESKYDTELLYAKDDRLYNSEYCEIYIPKSYFKDNRYAKNIGSAVEVFGLIYIRKFTGGKPGSIDFIDLPTNLEIQLYGSKEDVIKINGKSIDVVVLQFLENSFIMRQTTGKGREIAENFLDYVMKGKLPETLSYLELIDIWWNNLTLADVDFKIPSKMYEMILAAIYRSPKDMKMRFGQYLGLNANTDPYSYVTGNVRDIVESLSTFSGIIYEDIKRMITSGINNSLAGVEEPVSPLEKIMHY